MTYVAAQPYVLALAARQHLASIPGPGPQLHSAAVSRETSARDSALSAPTGSDARRCDCRQCARVRYRAARTLGEPQSSYLVALVPHERTRADRAPAKQRTHLSSMRPGRLSQPVLRPPSRGRAERGRTCIATRSRIWAPLIGLRAPRHIVPGVRDEWFCTIRGVGTYWGAPALLVRTR